MTHVIDTPLDFAPFDCGRLSRKIFALTFPGIAILALSASVGSLMLYTRPVVVPIAAKAPAVAAPRADAAPKTEVASNSYGALFDPRFSAGSASASLAQSFPLASNLEATAPAVSDAIAEPEKDMAAPVTATADPEAGETPPLPTPRPPELGAPAASQGPVRVPARRLAQEEPKVAAPSAPADNRSFFEKLFGGLQQAPRTVLAYAGPEDTAPGPVRRLTTGASPRYDRWTAIYDVSAHTVYMPDGTRLEAHSGLGDRLDDPRYVSERNRGATPPNVYDLALRETLFHGVPALRLKPVSGGDPYGRTGLLAHTFMLGPNGDSNGCVSFRNYGAFLQAFQNGGVKRLVVVARMN